MVRGHKFQRLTANEHKEILRGDGVVLHFDYSGGYMTTYVCQNSLNHILKKSEFYHMQMIISINLTLNTHIHTSSADVGGYKDFLLPIPKPLDDGSSLIHS